MRFQSTPNMAGSGSAAVDVSMDHILGAWWRSTKEMDGEDAALRAIESSLPSSTPQNIITPSTITTNTTTTQSPSRPPSTTPRAKTTPDQHRTTTSNEGVTISPFADKDISDHVVVMDVIKRLRLRRREVAAEAGLISKERFTLMNHWLRGETDDTSEYEDIGRIMKEWAMSRSSMAFPPSMHLHVDAGLGSGDDLLVSSADSTQGTQDSFEALIQVGENMRKSRSGKSGGGSGGGGGASLHHSLAPLMGRGATGPSTSTATTTTTTTHGQEDDIYEPYSVASGTVERSPMRMSIAGGLDGSQMTNSQHSTSLFSTSSQTGHDVDEDEDDFLFASHHGGQNSSHGVSMAAGVVAAATGAQQQHTHKRQRVLNTEMPIEVTPFVSPEVSPIRMSLQEVLFNESLPTQTPPHLWARAGSMKTPTSTSKYPMRKLFT